MQLFPQLIVPAIKCLFATIVLALLLATNSHAQPDDGGDAEAELAKQQAAARLNDIQTSLADKRKQLAELQEQLKIPDPEQREGLQQRVDALNKELTGLQQTFEQIATNGVDLEVFDVQPEQFDWRNELVQVTRPLLENLKNLTEKPRRIDRLRREIEQNERQLQAAEQAVQALAGFQDQSLSDQAKQDLTALAERWQQRRAEIERNLEVSRYQLANLLGQNVSWWDSLGETLSDFFYHRGLTLALATVAAVLVWLLLRALRWLQEKKFAGAKPRQRSLRRRLIAYGYRLLTTLLVIAAVLAVFYVRGDLLLLILSLVVLGFLLLSFRQVLPRYVNEFKLLLNIGPVREGERLIYNELPWQIKSINLYSVLRNPDLEGVIRLPLATLADMQSRPCGEEPWFPTRVGDFVLLPEGLLGEVLRQTPERVQVKTMGGMIQEYPTAQFMQLALRNLSRGGSFAVPVIFGIDYRHQAICLDQVPKTFHQALEEALQSAGLGDNVQNILVDFKAAAASSLDYLVAITMKSPTAASYFKIERLIQQTCVEVCNRHNWDIPFAQLTIHPGAALKSIELAAVQPTTA